MTWLCRKSVDPSGLLRWCRLASGQLATAAAAEASLEKRWGRERFCGPIAYARAAVLDGLLSRFSSPVGPARPSRWVRYVWSWLHVTVFSLWPISNNALACPASFRHCPFPRPMMEPFRVAGAGAPLNLPCSRRCVWCVIASSLSPEEALSTWR